MKLIIGISAMGILLIVGGKFWAVSQASKDTNILSTTGVHTHPELKIFVKGESVEIPTGVGIGAVHDPMHTHEDAPIIHLEYPSLVKREDTRLGKFFQIWGKDFREFGQNVTMTVNGEPNTEFESYEMKDGDKIELRYD